MTPAEPEQRSQFAAGELRERAEAEAAGDAARIPDQVTPGRDPAELAADATALVRCAFLLMIFARVRRGRAGAAEVADKRSRVDARASRVGGRLGPRLGGLFGGALFWAGVVGEIGTEALEELIDRELEAAAERQADERARSLPNSPGGPR